VELRHRPDEVVLRARSQLGYPVSEDGRREIQAAVDRARRYRSGHRYALSDFNLTEDDIRQGFADPAIDLFDVSPRPQPTTVSASTNNRHANETTHVT
jgi:hypothetical protein